MTTTNQRAGAIEAIEAAAFGVVESILKRNHGPTCGEPYGVMVRDIGTWKPAIGHEKQCEGGALPPIGALVAFTIVSDGPALLAQRIRVIGQETPVVRTCRGCQAPFEISAVQRAWFERHKAGFSLPLRCKACRRARRGSDA